MMMKTKLAIVLALLCVIGLEGVVSAGTANVNSGPAFKADGVAQTRRRKRRRARRVRRTRSSANKAAPVQQQEQITLPPPPEPEAGAPPAEEPTNAAPAPPASDPQDAPGRGGSPVPSKSGPRIKPPTVQIKPPTK
jgi:hypothetical protein